jgi:hypothetical protein
MLLLKRKGEVTRRHRRNRTPGGRHRIQDLDILSSREDCETMKQKGLLVTWTRLWTRSANSPRRWRRDRSRIRMKASYIDEQSEAVVVNLINIVVEALSGSATWLSNVQILERIRK